MDKILLYKYAGHINTINKNLDEPVTVTGKNHNDLNLLHPVITIQYDGNFDFNYCYIPATGRYYFINSVTNTGGQKYLIHIDIDPLKTYEQQILGTTATVTESSDPDPYISNRQGVYDLRPNYEKLNFPVTGLFNPEGKMIMITIKGK